MVRFVEQPTIIEAAGNKPKKIEEYIGCVNSSTETLSIARMCSPAGWVESPQVPDFDEYTVVLRGVLQVETSSKVFELRAGQAIIVSAGEWVRYSSPQEEGAEYIAVCVPAFTPETVNREGD